jgi:hypothetical protein
MLKRCCTSADRWGDGSLQRGTSLGSQHTSHVLAAALVLADAATEGKKVILGMMITGLILVALPALGETYMYLRYHRCGPRPALDHRRTRSAWAARARLAVRHWRLVEEGGPDERGPLDQLMALCVRDHSSSLPPSALSHPLPRSTEYSRDTNSQR